MVLEDADLLADRAVRDAQFIGGGREAQPGGRLEYPQRLERRQAVTGHVRPRRRRLRGASLCCDFPRFPVVSFFRSTARSVRARVHAAAF